MAVTIAAVYALDGRWAGEGVPYHRWSQLGRFGRNIALAQSLGVQVRPLPLPGEARLRCPAHGEIPAEVTSLALFGDRSSDLQLRIDLSVPRPPDVPRVLACTCFDRDDLLLGDLPLMTVLDQVLRPAGASSGAAVHRFGLDVHQVVTLEQVPDGWAEADAVRVVYREQRLDPVAGAPLARPLELNRFVGQSGAHGRGVTLLVGHDPATVNACLLIVHHLLFVMYRLRALAQQSAALLTEASRAAGLVRAGGKESVGAGVRGLALLARRSQRLEIALAFDVEAPLNSGLIPEIVLESYRESLRAVVGLNRSIDTVSGAVTRVQSFLRSSFEQLSGEAQSAQAEREAVRVRIATVVSALVIPTALLFGYFGVNAAEVPPARSMFDQAYAPVWLAFAASIVASTAIVLRLTGPRVERSAPMITLLSAHRGGPEGTYRPNSLEAIEAVTGVGVDLIEFDVRVTRDARFVTGHDAVVEVAGRPAPIAELTEAEVLNHSVDAAPLEEVLRAIRGRAMAHVDLKDIGHEVEIADVCERLLGPDGFVLTTLEDVSVRTVRQARPHLQVALSLGRDATGLGLARKVRLRWSELFPAGRVRRADPTMLAVNHRIARAGVLRWARRKGIPVLVWTVNEPDLMRWAWAEKRIWAFTTDYPRMALDLRPGAFGE